MQKVEVISKWQPDQPRYGLLPGTFDPPHLGHIGLAIAAIEALNLNRLFFLPASQNLYKRGQSVSPAFHRLEMCKLICKMDSRFEVCDNEIKLGGPSFTIESLRKLKRETPGNYWLIVGSDVLKLLPSWRHIEDILLLCDVAYGMRAEFDGEFPTSTIEKSLTVPLSSTYSEVSSSVVKQILKRGGFSGDYLTPEVEDYILRYRLYVE